MADELLARERSSIEARRAGRPIHRSKSLIAAVVVTLIGGAMWVYSAATATAATASGGDRQSSGAPAKPGAGSSLASGLAPTGGDPAPGSDAGAERPAASRLIDDSAPATFRLGASFVGGFLIAWVFRKFIKAMVIVAGLLIAGVLAAKHFGLLNFDWNSAEKQVHEGVEWAGSKAGTVKAFLTGYLPSSASAVTGMFFGARRG